MHPFLMIAGRAVPVYGICIVAGAAAALLLMYYCRISPCHRNEDAVYASLYGAVGAILGGKLLYILTVLPFAAENLFSNGSFFSAVLFLFRGGYVFFGGLLGGIAAVWFYCRRFCVPVLDLLDRIIVFVPFVHCCGRIGCFFAGCCYGISWSGPLAVNLSASPFCLAEGTVFPVQLGEALADLLLFGVLFLRGQKLRKEGTQTGCYFVIYSCVRFFLEFLRGDVIRGIICGLSLAQWICIPLTGLGIFLIFRRGPFDSSQKVI